MMDLVNYLIKDFAMKEITKAKDFAETEAKRLADILRNAIQEGFQNAVTAVMPVVLKTGLYLIGGAFFLYGLARFIDTIVPYEGLGFMLVGVIGLIIALLIGSAAKK